MKKFFIGVCFLVFVLSISISAFADTASVVVTSLAGDVKVTPQGASQAVACKPNMNIKEGTRIVTGAESYVELAFNRAKDNVAKVSEKSDVIIKLDGPDRIELIEGSVVALMKGLENGEAFRIRTPDAVCGARGTGWLTSALKGITDVGVFDNKVFVRGLNKDGSVKEKEFWVKKGFERKIKRFDNPGNQEKMSEKKMSGLKNQIKLPGGGGGWFSNKMKGMGANNKMREKRIEGMQNKKDERKLDQIRDKDKSECNSGSSEGHYITKG